MAGSAMGVGVGEVGCDCGRGLGDEVVTGMMRGRWWGAEVESEGKLALACNGHVPTRAESLIYPGLVSPLARIG